MKSTSPTSNLSESLAFASRCVCVCVISLFGFFSSSPIYAAIKVTFGIGDVISLDGNLFVQMSDEGHLLSLAPYLATLTCADPHCESCAQAGSATVCDLDGCDEGYWNDNGICVSTTYMSAYCQANDASINMQSWDGCGALTLPASNNYTQGPCLTDSRDGKVYQVRKFPDGRCWMVENLRYGGESDACAGRARFENYGESSYPSNRFGGGTYGDCADPTICCDYQNNCGSCSSYCSTVAGTGRCGYYYNWQAVMQHSDARSWQCYDGGSPRADGDICPTGWHVPTASEFDQMKNKISSNTTSFNVTFSGSRPPGGNYTFGQGYGSNYWLSSLQNTCDDCEQIESDCKDMCWRDHCDGNEDSEECETCNWECEDQKGTCDDENEEYTQYADGWYSDLGGDGSYGLGVGEDYRDYGNTVRCIKN
jgi:uncharacterized protein (TIGR02145 family)